MNQLIMQVRVFFRLGIGKTTKSQVSFLVENHMDLTGPWLTGCLRELFTKSTTNVRVRLCCLLL